MTAIFLKPMEDKRYQTSESRYVRGSLPLKKRKVNVNHSQISPMETLRDSNCIIASDSSIFLRIGLRDGSKNVMNLRVASSAIVEGDVDCSDQCSKASCDNRLASSRLNCVKVFDRFSETSSEDTNEEDEDFSSTNCVSDNSNHEGLFNGRTIPKAVQFSGQQRKSLDASNVNLKFNYDYQHVMRVDGIGLPNGRQDSCDGNFDGILMDCKSSFSSKEQEKVKL